jgi:regulatory protein
LASSGLRAPFTRKKSERKDLSEPAAVQTALAALLAKRDYAIVEVQSRLIERGAPAAVAAAAVADFVARGYLNDSRYAEKYLAYAARNGHGPVRIARDLRERGVRNEDIAQAMENGPDWRALCEELRRRRFGPQAPASWAEKGRQARFLQYRGFSSDHMRLAVSPDPDEPDPTDPDPTAEE